MAKSNKKTAVHVGFVNFVCTAAMHGDTSYFIINPLSSIKRYCPMFLKQSKEWQKQVHESFLAKPPLGNT